MAKGIKSQRKVSTEVCNDFAVVVTNYVIGTSKMDDRVYNFLSEDSSTQAACNQAWDMYAEQCKNDFDFYMSSTGSKTIELIVNGKVHKQFSIIGQMSR